MQNIGLYKVLNKNIIGFYKFQEIECQVLKIRKDAGILGVKINMPTLRGSNKLIFLNSTTRSESYRKYCQKIWFCFS